MAAPVVFDTRTDRFEALLGTGRGADRPADALDSATRETLLDRIYANTPHTYPGGREHITPRTRWLVLAYDPERDVQLVAGLAENQEDLEVVFDAAPGQCDYVVVLDAPLDACAHRVTNDLATHGLVCAPDDPDSRTWALDHILSDDPAAKSLWP